VSKSASTAEDAAISAADARRLFADWNSAATLVLAVSGGPDSTALMWLAAKWRNSLKRPPRLVAVTVDHGLREESRSEARAVEQLAGALAIEHLTLRWRGQKPKTGLPAAARDARYRLLAGAARKIGAAHILTAHTRDDQAETLMMRLARGSGVTGLAAMARHAPLGAMARHAPLAAMARHAPLAAMPRRAPRGAIAIGRPLLDVPKARLIATLQKAKVNYADDPTNRDPAFTRARFRQLMPLLAREGIDARNLARLAQRLGRANRALEAVVSVMEQSIGRVSANSGIEIDARAFATLPDEIALRLLGRAIAAAGSEGPAELAKLESLLAGLRTASAARAGPRLKQTLAGAVIALGPDLIVVERAPPRRRR
jgi:tRNA(Ile)-lysidine synthase